MQPVAKSEIPMLQLPRLTKRFVTTLGLLVALCRLATPEERLSSSAAALPTGEVIASIPCAADSTQTYSLYLPSTYSLVKAWPVIYIFDPEARGKIPVEMYRETAEKYGYILAASNTSRNFQSAAVTKTVQAIWDDTHLRLALDPRRIYTMGFSGGARVATTLALRCETCAVAGVIAHGAGYPNSSIPSASDRFVYFAFIGTKDFNWPELIELRRKKEELGAPFHLEVFTGDHQWAPPAIFGKAVEWLQLKAMQKGTVRPDPAFIEGLFVGLQKEAEAAAENKDLIAQFEAYRSLVFDFSGLKDVGSDQVKLAALKSSRELKQAFKKEQDGIEQQRRLTQDLSEKLAQLADADSEARQTLRGDINDGMITLRNQIDHEKNEEKRVVFVRAFDDLWVQAIEAGQAEMEISKNPAKAEIYFELMSSVTPKQPWPVLLLAEASAARGDKKRALKYLRDAVNRGLKQPESIENDANLQSLRSEAEFQQIIDELKAPKS